eukprot:TRINITY_DN6171_c0_g1_i1.p1 TRINITY_DN6171_c0_g1~~TRINITY_DN6171_c0_g1_i1.p1  ORF type:complete len:407 (+),score=110.68 TRINITY_DN6171_c0_g1_i1:102-1322(+)
MTTTDLYIRLEISKDVTTADIKKAYRRLALKHHPDRNKGNEKSSEEKFKLIQEAYIILSDPEKRKDYDLTGIIRETSDSASPPQSSDSSSSSAGTSATGNFSSEYQSTSNANGTSYYFHFHAEEPFINQRSNINPDDIRPHLKQIKATVPLSFKDAIMGATQTVSFEYQANCVACRGTRSSSGRVSDTVCRTCLGSGKVGGGAGGGGEICNECGGSGSFVYFPCEICEGIGSFPAMHEEQITIPAGVDSTFILTRQIQPDTTILYDGTSSMDIYELIIDFAVEQHPVFRRVGLDILIDLPISYAQAVLGDIIMAPSPYGGVLPVTIPPGAQPNSQIVLSNQGVLAEYQQIDRGDMILTLVLEVPRAISEQEQILLCQLGDLEQQNITEKRQKFLQFMVDWESSKIN